MSCNTGTSKSNSVYIISLAITAAVVIWGLVSPASFGAFAKALNGGLTKYYGWGYLLTMNIFVAFCLFIGCSRFGKMRLGPEDSRPEYSNLSWVAMLFSAGMGVGLVFYGAAEPLFYYASTPLGAEPGSIQAARDAMQVTVFHWGLHPWAGYSVIALPLAYYQFRHNAPGLISTIFIPLVGEERVRGAFGKTVDILAIFATLAGLTTSLGLGTLQLNSGLKELFGVPQTTMVQLIIIAFLAFLYTGSAVLGIDKGIKFVADWNIRHLLRHHGCALLRRPDACDTQLDSHEFRRLYQRPHQGILHDRALRRRLRGSPPQLDALLLGLVDCVGALLWLLHRSYLARTHHPRVHRRSPHRPGARKPHLVRHLRHLGSPA